LFFSDPEGNAAWKVLLEGDLLGGDLTDGWTSQRSTAAQASYCVCEAKDLVRGPLVLGGVKRRTGSKTGNLAQLRRHHSHLPAHAGRGEMAALRPRRNRALFADHWIA